MAFSDTRPEAIEPTVEPGSGPGAFGPDSTLITHPAFAMIGAHRQSIMGGSEGGVRLYGSDFVHHNLISLKIHYSHERRDLSHDWRGATGQIIEVLLSEAQWATFVSSLNVGDGVPCTLAWLTGKGQIPAIAGARDKAATFANEAKKDLASIRAAVTEAREALEAAGAGKGLSGKAARELIDKLKAAERDVTANLPFVAESFSRHMEATVEKAKVEVHGYAAGALQRMGLAALAAQNADMLALDTPAKPDEEAAT